MAATNENPAESFRASPPSFMATFQDEADRVRANGHYDSWVQGVNLQTQTRQVRTTMPSHEEGGAFQAKMAAEAAKDGRALTHNEQFAQSYEQLSLANRADALRAEIYSKGADAIAAFHSGEQYAEKHWDNVLKLPYPMDNLTADSIQTVRFHGAAEEAKRAGHYDSWLEGVKLGVEQSHLEANRPEIGEVFAFQDDLRAYKLAQTGSEALTSHEALAESSADLSHIHRMQAAKEAAEKSGPDAVEAQLVGHAYGMEHAERGAKLYHADQLTAEAVQNLHFHGAAEEAQRDGHFESWADGVKLGFEGHHLENSDSSKKELEAFQERKTAASLAAHDISTNTQTGLWKGYSFGMEHAGRNAERNAELGLAAQPGIDRLTAEALQHQHFSAAAEEAKRAGHYDSWSDGVKLGVEGHRLENAHPSSEEALAFQERKTAASAAAHAVSDNAQAGLWHGYKFGMEHAERNAELGVTKESAKVLAEDGVKLLAKDAVKMVAGGPVGDAMALKDVAEIASKAPSVSSLLASDAGYSAVSALAAATVVGGAKHLADEYGITAKLDPVIDAARHHMEPATKALHSFQDGVQDFIHKGDAVIASAQHYAHEKLDPVIEPVQKVAAEAASHVAKAAEPLTKPVEERMAAVGTVVSTAVGKGWDSAMSATERHEAEAVQQAYGSLLKATAHGSPGLTNDEARMVRAELPHVQKGDVFVVEPQGSMHLVPAGATMPEFPKGSLHLDADALREAAGIERAPQQHASQQFAQADAVRER